jgi:flagellar biosynthesis regulator FlaF
LGVTYQNSCSLRTALKSAISMVREAEKKAKEELRKTHESAEYQNRVEKKRLTDISRYKKQCANLTSIPVWRKTLRTGMTL